MTSFSDSVPTGLSTRSVGTGDHIGLVHGFTQTGASWDAIVASLSTHLDVTTVDLPGHGESTDFVVTEFPDAAKLVANAVGIASYVGYSMGGRICLQLALDAPHLVERLVLIGATPGIANEDERLARRQADDVLADGIDPLEEFFPRWLSQYIFSDLGRDQQDLDARSANTAVGLASALRSLGTGNQEPLFDRLSELEMPVLLIAGERDEKFSEIAIAMGNAIGANARVELIANAIHAAPFSQPTRFIDVLEDFFTQNPVS